MKVNTAQLINAISPSILDLHILPTEKCNFRCTYCYEDFSIGKMHAHTITGIKNLIRRRMPALKQLRIAWFGGEPLAAMNVVLDISSYGKELAEQHDCHYHFGMTTNAYLLDKDRFEKVIHAGIRSFQISLDGPEQVHNQTRLRADGAGTFRKIWDNLIRMKNSDHSFDVVLRIHITPQNFSHIQALLDMIKINFHQDKRFSVFLKAIANLGGPNSGKFDYLQGKTKEEILAQLNDYLGPDIRKRELTSDGSAYICYASSQNAWVVRADGRLAKCTVAFNDERNNIGRINEDGSLTFDQEKIALWLRGLKNLDTTTLGCPAYKLPKLENTAFKNIPINTK